MKRRLLILLVAVMLLSVCISGCNSGDKTATETEPTKTEATQADATQETGGEAQEPDSPEIVNNTYKTGYPIVEEPIALDVVVSTSSLYADFNEMVYWKAIEEQTNIDLNFNMLIEDAATKLSLMFASQDFPDIMMAGPNDDQILEASLGGSIYQLDDLIAEYAPNWVNFFAEYPYGLKVAKMADGNIWSLPQVRWQPSNYGIRDQTMINVAWLDELGLEMPTTTDDFYEVLKAFKDNAGTGTIPENMVPWALSFMAYANGTNIELFNSFGVFVNDDSFISVDENGQIVFSAKDPKIKDALKFFNKLYQEELILPEAFTMDGNTLAAQVLSEEPMVGVFTRYHNPDITEETYDAMPPLYGPDGQKPYYRIQNNMVVRNYFTIFKDNEYPEATMRLANLLAEPDQSIQAMYGPFDIWLTKDDDGGITMVPDDRSSYTQDSPGNNIAFILTPDMFDNFTYLGSQQIRAKNIREVYSDFTIPEYMIFPRAIWNEDQTQRRQDIETDLKAYIKSTFADWIVNGGIDEGWDEYLSNLERLRADDYIALYQEVLDVFNQD